MPFVPSPRVSETSVAAMRSVPSLDWSKEKLPTSDWPATLRLAFSASNLVTRSAVSKTTATGSALLPSITSDSLIAIPVVLTATTAVPEMVTPSIPMNCTVPTAWSAYSSPVLVSTLTRPIVASVRSTPVASGLMSPLSRRAGPSPRKISRLVPAKVLPVKDTSPEISTKSPMRSVTSETETAMRSPSSSPKRIGIDRAPTCTVSSTAAPVLLIRTLTVPSTATTPSVPMP